MRQVPGGYIVASFVIALLLAGGLPFLAQPQPQAAATPQPSGTLKASAIQIQQIEAEEVKLPAEFQMALYENVMEEVTKTKKFEHVYRDGDHNAADAADLVILHSTVKGFKQGSARARQVTTFSGATHIKVHLQFTDKSGKSILESDVEGRVKFFGENLRATHDFGKKAAAVVRQNFMAQPAAK